MKVYPVFLNDLGGRRCVVFGGGGEAERKAAELVECGARPVVVSPDITAGIAYWVNLGAIEWVRRPYAVGDLRGAFLAIVADFDYPVELRSLLWEEAQAEGVLLNSMDDVERCSFVAGSVVRRGPLVVAISTSGAAPTVAVRLREHLEEVLDPTYADYLEILEALRTPMASGVDDFEKRRELWYRIVDSEFFAHLRSGDTAQAYAVLASIVGIDIARTVRAGVIGFARGPEGDRSQIRHNNPARGPDLDNAATDVRSQHSRSA